jgi:hypothetical protein
MFFSMLSHAFWLRQSLSHWQWPLRCTAMFPPLKGPPRLQRWRHLAPRSREDPGLSFQGQLRNGYCHGARAARAIRIKQRSAKLGEV